MVIKQGIPKYGRVDKLGWLLNGNKNWHKGKKTIFLGMLLGMYVWKQTNWNKILQLKLKQEQSPLLARYYNDTQSYHKILST